jgi:hypothetical protein
MQRLEPSLTASRSSLEIRDKPQITEISQITETKDFGVIRRKNASETKM